MLQPPLTHVYRGAEESSAMNETPGPVSKEEEVAQKDKKVGRQFVS